MNLVKTNFTSQIESGPSSQKNSSPNPIRNRIGIQERAEPITNTEGPHKVDMIKKSNRRNERSYESLLKTQSPGALKKQAQ